MKASETNIVFTNSYKDFQFPCTHFQSGIWATGPCPYFYQLMGLGFDVIESVLLLAICGSVYSHSVPQVFTQYSSNGYLVEFKKMCHWYEAIALVLVREISSTKMTTPLQTSYWEVIGITWHKDYNSIFSLTFVIIMRIQNTSHMSISGSSSSLKSHAKQVMHVHIAYRTRYC